MTDVQRIRFNEPSRPGTTERKERESQSGGVDAFPGVDRLDGVKKVGSNPYAGGVYYDVWMGKWKKGGDKKKVSLNKPRCYYPADVAPYRSP